MKTEKQMKTATVIFLKPLVSLVSLVRCMKDGDTDWGWGILISAARKKLTENNSVLDDSEPQWVLDVFLPCDPEDKDRPPADAKAEGRIFPMALTLVQKISKIRSNMPTGDAWLKILMSTN